MPFLFPKENVPIVSSRGCHDVKHATSFLFYSGYKIHKNGFSFPIAFKYLTYPAGDYSSKQTQGLLYTRYKNFPIMRLGERRVSDKLRERMVDNISGKRHKTNKN